MWHWSLFVESMCSCATVDKCLRPLLVGQSVDTPSLPFSSFPSCSLSSAHLLWFAKLKIFNLHFKFHKMEMFCSLKSFHVLWAGIWVSDCHLLAPQCHPLLGNPTWSQLSGHVFFLCGGTVKAERSAFHPRQLRALPVPFSFTRGYCLVTIFWGSGEKNSIHDRSVLCAVGKLLLSLVHKNLAWAFRSSLTFQISEKLGGHVGVISAPSVASLAAAEKGTLLLSWLPRCGRATFCLNVSLFSEAKQ